MKEAFSPHPIKINILQDLEPCAQPERSFAVHRLEILAMCREMEVANAMAFMSRD